MKELSLEPDERMRWIYNPAHPDYNSDMARDLRARRGEAIRNAPRWMVQDAQANDQRRALLRDKP
jgi:hypothetical protein